MGTPLFPWQQYVADVALEVDESGGWVYNEVVVTAQRRAGKTFLITPTTLHRCGQPVKSTSWITAQRLKSAVRRWEDVADQIVNSPARPRVRKNRGNPQVLRWPGTGSTFAPFAPSEDALHGEDPDLVWVDELWSFDFEQRRIIEQGYRPALRFNGGQAWLMSTAGTPRSEWLNQARRRGRAAVEEGRTDRLAYFEWSAPEQVNGIPIEQVDDEALILSALGSHPRAGQRGASVEDFAEELDSLGRIEFLRAYGNLTQNEDSVQAGAVFSSERMRDSRFGRIGDDARIALGVAADPDRRDAVIAVGWRGSDGRALTAYQRAEGTRWTVPEVLRLVDVYDVGSVAVQSAGPARDVADALELSGVELLRLSQPDTAAACSRFHDEFAAGLIGWDGSLDFSSAVAAAEVHRLQSGIDWRSRSGAPVTALLAGSLAVWGHDHMPEPAPVVEPRVW